MSENIKVLSDAEFDKDVLQAGKPVLVDFWAEWCGPCRALAPVFAEVATEKGGDVTFAKINIDDHPEAAQKYGVMSIPTLILFKNGQVAAVKMGLLTRSELIAFLESHI